MMYVLNLHLQHNGYAEPNIVQQISVARNQWLRGNAVSVEVDLDHWSLD